MKSSYKKLGTYIEPINKLNDGMEVKELLGINNNKYFQDSHTNTIGIDLATYRIVRTGQFAYNRATTRNGDKISISLRQGSDCIVSPSYRIFRSKDENVLNSEYLMMWFRRPEFDRYARFKSHGSAHEFFEYDQMSDVELPIPSITKQREIVKEYNTIQNRIALNQQLIQKLEETAQAIYKQWFVEGIDVENLPEGWRVGALEEISEYVNRGITPNYTETEGVIILNQKCVRNNSIDFEFSRKHNEDLKKIPDEKILKQYDILINSTGDGTLGRVGLVKTCPFAMTVDSHVTIFRINEFNNPLYAWGNISLRTDEIVNLAEGSTGQTELSRSLFSALPILIPDKSTQDKFANIVQKLIRHSYHLECESQKLTELKDLLLSKLATVEN